MSSIYQLWYNQANADQKRMDIAPVKTVNDDTDIKGYLFSHERMSDKSATQREMSFISYRVTECFVCCCIQQCMRLLY
jgi:hypothetical protein